MADLLNPSFKPGGGSYSGQTMQFQRSSERVKRKKIQRKVRLKFRHIFLYILLAAGIFVIVQQVWLFFLTWDNLWVKEIKITAQRPEVREEIQRIMEGKNLGNILLLDISHLQDVLSAHRWVKEVRIRKILPSTLEVEIKERIPFALLKKDRMVHLIDREGVLLERVENESRFDLPLLTDRGNFEKNYKEKLSLAWECLESLSPAEKEEMAVLDLSEYENVFVWLKNNPTKLILGNAHFSQKLRLYRRFSARLEAYGDLDYVDLRLPDRVFIRPVQNPFKGNFPNAHKEAN